MSNKGGVDMRIRRLKRKLGVFVVSACLAFSPMGYAGGIVAAEEVDEEYDSGIREAVIEDGTVFTDDYYGEQLYCKTGKSKRKTDVDIV